MRTFGMGSNGTWVVTQSPQWIRHEVNEATRRNVRYTLHHNPSMGTSWIVRHKVSGREVRKLSGNQKLAVKQWNEFLASF